MAFQSTATSLVPGDANALSDIFVRDMIAGATIRASIDSSGTEAAGGDSTSPRISPEGRFVVFQSTATNLVLGDSNAEWDIFIRDLLLGTTERVSIDSAGAQATGGASNEPAVSSGGQFVVFTSYASNLVSNDTNGWSDVFVRDRALGTTTRVSVSSTGAEAVGGPSSMWVPGISSDGRYVIFTSSADNLVPGDTNAAYDVFLRDRVLNSTTRVSVGSSGAQATGISLGGAISDDGQIVIFDSGAADIVSGDTNGDVDMFLRVLSTGTTIRISVDSSGMESVGGDSLYPALSRDGRFVAYSSSATNLVSNDTNSVADVFLRGPLR